MSVEIKAIIRGVVHFCVVIVLLLSGLTLNIPKAKAYITTFTTSGSWVAPAGVTSVTVEAWGGGGAGGGRGTSTGASGGGGGGAYAKNTISVIPASSYSYTVGAGGTGGTGNGPDGVDTVWDAGADVLADGGKGGLQATTKGLGGLASSSVGATTYKGGDGADAPGATGGGGGSGAGSTGAGNNASGVTAGAVKTQDGGPGGNGGANSNGAVASLYGGGGGGAHRTSGSRLGGNGTAGAIRISYSLTSTLSMQTGYYIGTGVASKAITGLGFAPDFVLVKADTAAGAAAFKTRLMADADMAFVTATADNAGSNLVLNSDGFTLGTNASVNSVGVRYTWIAFKGSDCTSSGVFCVGRYTGNGVSPRTISTGFDPDFVVVKRTTAVAAHMHTTSQPNNETIYLTNTVRDTTGNFIRSFGADGFDVGATDNTSGGVYNYIAFKNTANKFAEGTYAGNGTDNTNISTVGFAPDAVIVKNATNATANNTLPIMNNTSMYGDYATPLTAAANANNYIQSLRSDGFQVGNNVFTNSAGNTYYYVAFGDAPSPVATNDYEMATGNYTGNGGTQSITGLAFQPDLVIIKDNAANYQVFRTSMMKGDSTAYMSNAAANFTTGITSLNSDGFSVGASAIVNTNTNVYHYQAFGNAWNPETKTGAIDFAVGAYMGLGNTVDNRDITGLPWQPNMVTVKRNGASAGVWRSSATAGDLSSFFGATAEAANYIQALNSDGFQIGTNAVVNTAASLNYWFAFRSVDGFATGTYTGNAIDNTNIATVGFQPDLLWVKRSTAVNGVSRGASLGGDATHYFANLANVANRIQILQANGFQIGGNTTETNTNLATYRYVAWKGPAANILSVDIVDSGGSPVASPSYSMSSLSYLFDCLASTGTMGEANQKIRVNNDSVNDIWSLSIAATNGADELWRNVGDTQQFDFNDSSGTPNGCSDAPADTDTKAGRLTISVSAGTITPEGGCTNTNVTLGSDASFVEGSVDVISIVDASAGADNGCFWDITDIGLSQQIPIQQAPDTYSLNFTITAVSH